MRLGRKRTYGERSKSKSKSRPRKKAAFNRPLNSTGNTVMRPIGNKQVCRLRYCDYIALNPGAGGIAAVHVFAANGLYDPDITGIGHQPSGFDQLMQLFDHYTVISAKCRVEAFSADATYGQWIGVATMDQNGVLADQRAYIEGGHSNWNQVSPSTYGYQNAAVVEQTFSCKKFLGRPNPLDEDSLRGNSTQNPAEGAYFHVWCGPGGTLDGAGVNCQVTIDYFAILTEPKVVGLS